MDPKPIQQPHIPIIVGGHSRRAFRRTAEFGRGWYGFALDPEHTKTTLAGLDKALAARGRSRDDCEIIITPNTATADTIREFEDLGVDRLVLHLGSQRADKVDQRLLELEKLTNLAA